MNIGLCKYEECEHNQECKRYIDTIGEEFNFKVICNTENNYQWLWKIENVNSNIKSEESNDTLSK